MKSLVQLTAPETEPVTIEEAVLFLRLDNDAEQSLVQSMVGVAREVVENFTGRALMRRAFKLTLSEWPSSCVGYQDPFASRTIALERTPLVSVESVKYYPADGGAQATLSSSAYHVLTGPQPGLVVLKSDQTWPSLYDRPDAVEVSFTAGYATAADVPNVLRQAVLLMLSHVYENRGAINIGNIVNELPFSLKYMLESQRVGGWIA